MHSVVGANGKSVSGTLSGLEKVPVRMHDGTKDFNLKDASVVTIQKPGEDSAEFPIGLVVMAGDSVVYERTEFAPLRNSPIEAVARAKREQALRGDDSSAGRKFEGDLKEIALGGKASDIAMGGGGRYLMILIPEVRRIQVFDVYELKLVKLRQTVAETDVNYLYVTSEPPEIVTAGSTMRYQVTAKSKAGSLVYRLESGPDGMSVSPFGLVQWKTNRTTPPIKHDVLISIQDATGQEIFHRFNIRIIGR